MYRTCVLTGIAVAAVSYGLAALLSGFPGSLIMTLPIIVAFCLAVSIPVAFLGVGSAALFHRRRPTAPRAEWERAGVIFGLSAVIIPLVPLALGADALGSDAGTMFWATFVVAACIAGVKIGARAWESLAKGRVTVAE